MIDDMIFKYLYYIFYNKADIKYLVFVICIVIHIKMLIKFPNIYVQNFEHNVFLFTVRNVKTVQHPNPDNEDSAVHPTRNFLKKPLSS